MKICKDCKKNKEESDFYGIQGECKKCTQKRVQANYRLNINHYIEYEKMRSQLPERKRMQLLYQKRRRAKYPNKNRARNKVSNAIRDGKLEKLPCEVCQNPVTEAHHLDYRSPLKIQWLCRQHHLEIEGKIAYKNNNYDR